MRLLLLCSRADRCLSKPTFNSTRTSEALMLQTDATLLITEGDSTIIKCKTECPLTAPNLRILCRKLYDRTVLLVLAQNQLRRAAQLGSQIKHHHYRGTVQSWFLIRTLSTRTKVTKRVQTNKRWLTSQTKAIRNNSNLTDSQTTEIHSKATRWPWKSLTSKKSRTKTAQLMKNRKMRRANPSIWLTESLCAWFKSKGRTSST